MLSRSWPIRFPSCFHLNEKEDRTMRNFILAAAAATGLLAAGAAGASAAPALHSTAQAPGRNAITNVYYGDGYYGGGYYRNDYPRHWHRRWDYPRYAYGPPHHWHHRYWEQGRWYYR
jgi:hypothetical protein